MRLELNRTTPRNSLGWMREHLLRQSVCLHSQSPPRKLCVDDESLDSLGLVRTGAAINQGASHPRRFLSSLFFFLLSLGFAGCRSRSIPYTSLVVFSMIWSPMGTWQWVSKMFDQRSFSYLGVYDVINNGETDGAKMVFSLRCCIFYTNEKLQSKQGFSS